MAIHITRVYTRGGDTGQTSLVGGARVDKDCRKLESYGTVDELICLVGTARTVIAGDAPKGLPKPVRAEMETSLRRVQNRLFDMGSILATPAGQSYAGMPEISDGDASDLEKEMDRMQKSLEPLNSFVLPGGTLANAALHECRAVCRRAEREIMRLSREEPVDKRLIKYINRLSDFFFVMSRYASRKAGVKEYLWEYGLGASAKAASTKPAKPATLEGRTESKRVVASGAGSPVKGKPVKREPAGTPAGKLKALVKKVSGKR
ncbi:MAG: cobO [Fibrobacteres bacterium]|nr:cobO [Fibrobacterota bacterium]